MYILISIILIILSLLLWVVWMFTNLNGYVKGEKEGDILNWKFPIMDDIIMILLVTIIWVIVTIIGSLIWPISLIFGIVVYRMKTAKNTTS